MKPALRFLLILLIFVILISGGVFLCQTILQKPEQKGSPEDYQILETEEGKIIENKKAGLRFRVPDGWIVEKIEVMEGSIIIYSPDAEGMRPGKVNPPLKKGCIIETAVAYKKTNLEEIRREVEEAHKAFIVNSDRFELTEINELPALKNIFDSADLGYSIDIYILTENVLYGLGITAAPEDIKECSQEFDEFLKTVSID